MELKGVYGENDLAIIDSLTDKMKFLEELVEESLRDQQVIIQQQRDESLYGLANDNRNRDKLIKLNQKVKSFENIIGLLGSVSVQITDERVPEQTQAQLATLCACLEGKSAKDIEDKINKTIFSSRDERRKELGSVVGEIQKALAEASCKNLRFSNDGVVSDRPGFKEFNTFGGTKDLPSIIKDVDKAVQVYEEYLSQYSKTLTARPLTLSKQEIQFAPSAKIIDDIVLIHQIKRNDIDRKVLHEVEKIEEALLQEDKYSQAQTLALELTAQGKGLDSVGKLDFSKAIEKIQKEVEVLRKDSIKASQYLSSFDYKNRLKEISVVQTREREEKDKILPPHVAGPIFNLFMQEFREKAKEPLDDIALYNIDLQLLKIMDENNVNFQQYCKIRTDAENAYAKEVLEKNEKQAKEGLEKRVEARQEEMAQEKVEAEMKKETAKVTVENIGKEAQDKVANQPAEVQIQKESSRINEIANILSSIQPDASSLYVQDMSETIAGYEKVAQTGMLFAVYYAKTHNGKFMDEATEKWYDNYLSVLQNMKANNATNPNNTHNEMEM